MIHGLEDVRQGYDVSADVVVVGSGAAGAVAAANYVEAGFRTVLVEAGPAVRAAEMTRDAPKFLARYYWDGGLRLIQGTMPIPSMQGRCLGGSTVVNSAIMLPLPRWVRARWAALDGIDWVTGPEVDRSFDRIFARTGVAPTPMAVMGRRNLIVRDALDAVGIDNNPLPRAVQGCNGCADCITGCSSGAKQSVDRSWIPSAVDGGLEVFTCSEVDRVLTERGRAVGVTGQVVDAMTWQRLGRFTVRAPRVVLAPGVMATPCILIRSGINPHGRVGATLHMHLTGGVVGIMDEVVEPWTGATQGWGAISQDIHGLKFESLWAHPSLISVRWGGIGDDFYRQLPDVKHATLLVCVYAGETRGSVKPGLGGRPKMRLWIPREEIRPIQKAMHQATVGLLRVGARYVYSGLPGVDSNLRTEAQAEQLLSPHIRPRHVSMTGNHVFSSCRMSADPRKGPVDTDGRVRGVDGLWVVDTSIFPGPTAVNPQATAMVMSDLITRRAASLPV